MNFDDIDLEELAGSESPILETGAGTPTADKDDELPNPIIDPNAPVDDPEAVDLDLLEGLGDDTTEVDDLEGGDDEDEKKPKVPTVDTEATSSSQNKFTSLAKALVEAGTFDEIPDEDLASIKDAGSLLEFFDKQVKANEFAGLNEDQKQYLTALEAGVPHDTFIQTKANADQYAKFTDEALAARPDIAEELIKRSFLIKGVSPEKASKFAALAAKDPSFQEDAVDARNALVAFENGKIQDDINARNLKKETDLATAQADLAKLKSTILETPEVMPGIKVNSATREKIFQSMTTPTKVNGEKPLNEVMEKYSTDPEYKRKLHTLDVLTKGFTDFSKFTKTAKSKAAQDLENNLENNNTRSRTGGSMATGVVSASQTEMKNALDFLKLK